CPDSNGKNQELLFPTQTFNTQNLQLTRKVFVAHNDEFARWLNIITNTGSADAQVGISLKGLLASGTSTQINATSTGGTALGAQDPGSTSSQSVRQARPSLEPRLGSVAQNTGAAVPATSVGVNSFGQVVFPFTPTTPAGGTAIVMTFVTVQGKNKN